MGFFEKLLTRNRPIQVEPEQRSDDEPVFGLALQYNGWSTFRNNQSMTLSAVYRCVEVISDSVASLPVKLYAVDGEGYKVELHNELSRLLSKRPNNKMNAFTFYKLIVRDILMAGNGYALILRDGNGNVNGLQYVQPGLVSPIDRITYIEYQVAGVKGFVRAEDMLHFINYSENGVFGISVLTHARRTLGIADAGDKAAEHFYQSGGCTTGFLKFDGPSNSKQREEILSAWNMANSGPNNQHAGIPVLPSNVSYTQLSISPADGQLLESRKFEVEEIARFFGVSPLKLFDLSKSSYNNIEAEELSFLNDTLRPLITKIEQELENKLFKDDSFDIKFDVSELLRTDKKSQVEYFTKLFNIGSLTPNEIRKQLDLMPVDGGDISVAQINMTSIKNLETINATADNRLKEPELQDTNENENEDDTQDFEK